MKSRSFWRLPMTLSEQRLQISNLSHLLNGQCQFRSQLTRSEVWFTFFIFRDFWRYIVATFAGSSLKSKARKALKEIEDKTSCITFKEVTDSPNTPHIQIREVQTLGEGVCANSPLGRQQTVNVVNVATTCQVRTIIVMFVLQ